MLSHIRNTIVMLALVHSGLVWAGGAPVVLSTKPAIGDRTVPGNLDRICVTFDRKMRAGSWSWAYTEREKFPELAGQPYYDDEMKTNCVRVRLQRDTEYEIWINSARHSNFKSESGVPAVPYLLRFRTGR